MAYTRTLTARQAGPIQLILSGYSCDIEVTATASQSRAEVDVYTSASSGPTIELIEKLALRERSGEVGLKLPEEGGITGVVISGNGSIIQAGGGIVVGRGIRMATSSSAGGSYSSVHVNGQHIEVRNGRTFINGRDVTGTTGPAPEPMAEIHLRARVPEGSSVDLQTYNGSLTTLAVGQVELETYNGSIRATGLVGGSRLETYNGHITVGAAPGSRPAVKAQTYNGDITVLDDDVRLRPSTYNGQVRYPS